MNESFLIIIILLSFMLSPCESNCPNSIQVIPALSSKSCNFYFTTSSSTCTFTSCRSKGSDTSPYENAGWSECFSQCCLQVASQLSSTSDNVELILSCQNAQHTKQVKFIIILSVLMGSLVISMVILFICYHKQSQGYVRKSCPLNKCREKQPQEAYEDRDKKNPINSLKNLLKTAQNPTSIELDRDNKDTTITNILGMTFSAAKSRFNNSTTKKNIRLLQSKCMVCQQSKPNCQLNCNHELHWKCLGMWFQRNPAAPCGDSFVKVVRVYCYRCLRCMGAHSLHKFKKMYKGGEEKFMCQQCLEGIVM